MKTACLACRLAESVSVDLDQLAWLLTVIHHHHLFAQINWTRRRTHDQHENTSRTRKAQKTGAYILPIKKTKITNTLDIKTTTTTHTVKTQRNLYMIKWPFKFRQWWKVNGMRQKIPNIYNSFNKKVSLDWAYTSRFIQLITMSSCVCHSTKREQVSRIDILLQIMYFS